MVVSEMGVTWSPKTEPDRMEAMTEIIRSSSFGALRNAACVATGNRIAMVPHDVPEQNNVVVVIVGFFFPFFF